MRDGRLVAALCDNRQIFQIFAMLSIINAKWKTARQHPVKFEVQRMNAAETGETPDIDQ